MSRHPLRYTRNDTLPDFMIQQSGTDRVFATKGASADEQDLSHSRRHRRFRRAIAWTCGGYLISLLIMWATLRLSGDRWWLATMLLFGPRWLCSLPLVLLVPLAACFRRRQLGTLAIAGVVILFPILDLRIPWRRVLTPAGPQLRVFTYNVCADSVPAETLATAIQDLKADVVALQECRPSTFAEVFRNWHVCSHGELLLAARFPIRVKQIQTSIHSPHKWPRTTLLECVGEYAGAEISICTVHLPSPRYGLTKVIDKSTLIAPGRRDLLDAETADRDAVSAKVATAVSDGPGNRLVMGDFNMTTDSHLYRRDWSNYANAFSQTGWGFGRTMRAPVRGFVFGIRIDQVLTNGDWSPARCWVGPDLGSDHLPVVADIVWRGPEPLPSEGAPALNIRPRETEGAEPKSPSAKSRSPEPLPVDARPSSKSVLRTWTSLSGHQIEAGFVSEVDGVVRLQKSDGKRTIIQFDQLSAEDQQFLRSLHPKS